MQHKQVHSNVLFKQLKNTGKAPPAKPAEDMCTTPLFGTKTPLKVSFDFEYAAK